MKHLRVPQAYTRNALKGLNEKKLFYEYVNDAARTFPG